MAPVLGVELTGVAEAVAKLRLVAGQFPTVAQGRGIKNTHEESARSYY
ncbi:MAG: hypothetical protein ACXWNZ_18240 [Vulcanimicrobiaceae bacterium]